MNKFMNQVEINKQAKLSEHFKSPLKKSTMLNGLTIGFY